MQYSLDQVTQAPEVSEARLREILLDSYGILNGKIIQLTGYEDANFRVNNVVWKDVHGPKEVIVKITNPIEAQRVEHMNFQVSLCSLLSEAGIPCPVVLKRLDGRSWATEEVQTGLHLPVRVFAVLSGNNLEEFKFTPELVKEIGATLAKLHVEVDRVPELSTNHIPFISPENIDCLELERRMLLEQGILSEERAELVGSIWEEYKTKVTNQKERFDVGLIHSDFNETNLLIEDQDEIIKISGVLDFGDAHVTVRALDVAATILYLHLSDIMKQGISALASNVLEGYSSVRPFSDHSILLICIRARLACSLIYGLRTARINYRGGSTEYVLKTQSNGWSVLKELCQMESL